MVVKIGSVNQFPPNIFWSENKPNVGALVYGRDVSQPGPSDRGNRWFRVAFSPGATYDDVGTDRAKAVEPGGNDPGNGGTLGGWQPILGRGTVFVRSTIPALEGATVDSAGDAYVDDSKALAATLNGRYGSYVPSAGTAPGSAYSLGTTLPLPPGPTGAVTPQALDRALEFSFYEGVYWTARTPQTSAAVRDGNPHPGVSVLNPTDVAAYYGGQTPNEALGLEDYRGAGWTGLSNHFVAWNGTNGEPAGQELGDAMEAALGGDKAAQKALASVGVRPPGGKYHQGVVSTLEEDLAKFFG